MILFLDSSAVVKLFIEEPESVQVDEAVQQAQWIGVSSLAFAETTAAFVRRKGRKQLTAIQADEAFQALLAGWPGFMRYPVDERVTKQAGIVARTHSLTGADSIQLATADMLQREHRDVHFLAYDGKLNTAAARVVRLWVSVP